MYAEQILRDAALQMQLDPACEDEKLREIDFTGCALSQSGQKQLIEINKNAFSNEHVEPIISEI
jgi:hypothetical protein